MHALLLVNNDAGGNSQSDLDLLQQTALKLGHTLDVAVPTSAAQMLTRAQSALDDGYERLICAGGDGTINGLLPALLHSGLPLGIIPAGTANVLARELSIPFDPVQALSIALEGQVRPLDIGLANGSPFLLMAGLGFDAQVVAEIEPRMKELFGSLAYITSGLQVLTHYRPSNFTIEAEGEHFTVPAWLVVVGNASSYAYELEILPEARMDDGLLDVCIFAEHGALDRVTQLGAMLFGQHTEGRNVRYFQVTSLRISADPPVQVQLDGDHFGASPVDFLMQPSALQVVTPAKAS